MSRSTGPVRALSILIFCAVGLVSVLPVLAGKGPADATVEKPTFEVDGQRFTCPVQTGRGRKAGIGRSGLYRLPTGSPPAFGLGRKLKVLDEGVVFVRGVDNLYTGENAIWTGDLRIDGAPGVLPSPPVQGKVTSEGRFRALFHAEEDVRFHTNAKKEAAPSWYFPKTADIIGERVSPDGTRKENRVSVKIDALSPRPGPAQIRIGLNSNAPAGKKNRVTVFVNGADVVTAEWDGHGYRVVRGTFDGSLVRDGANVVELLGDAGYSKYCLLYTSPSPRD